MLLQQTFVEYFCCEDSLCYIDISIFHFYTASSLNIQKNKKNIKNRTIKTVRALYCNRTFCVQKLLAWNKTFDECLSYRFNRLLSVAIHIGFQDSKDSGYLINLKRKESAFIAKRKLLLIWMLLTCKLFSNFVVCFRKIRKLAVSVCCSCVSGSWFVNKTMSYPRKNVRKIHKTVLLNKWERSWFH